MRTRQPDRPKITAHTALVASTIALSARSGAPSVQPVSSYVNNSVKARGPRAAAADFLISDIAASTQPSQVVTLKCGKKGKTNNPECTLGLNRVPKGSFRLDIAGYPDLTVVVSNCKKGKGGNVAQIHVEADPASAKNLEVVRVSHTENVKSLVATLGLSKFNKQRVIGGIVAVGAGALWAHQYALHGDLGPLLKAYGADAMTIRNVRAREFWAADACDLMRILLPEPKNARRHFTDAAEEIDDAIDHVEKHLTGIPLSLCRLRLERRREELEGLLKQL